MTNLLLVNINDLDDSTIEQLKIKISAERREKAVKYYLIEDKKRCICAELLLQYYLQNNVGIGNDIEYFYNEFGKPFLKKNPTLNFNISHSKDLVLCGFSDYTIGVDIEKVQKCKHDIVKRYFSKEEMEYIYAGGKNDYSNRFIEIWTLKESYIKFIGKGLHTDLSSFSVNMRKKKIIIKNKVQDDIILKSLKYKDYFISMCLEEDSNVSLRVLNVQEMTRKILDK